MKTLKTIEDGPQVNQISQMTVIVNCDQLSKIKYGQISRVQWRQWNAVSLCAKLAAGG